MPGDVEFAELTVSNSGTAQLRYAMTASSSTTEPFDLADVATVAVREKAAGSCAADFTGTVVVSSTTLASAAFGDSAQGDQIGDRSLAASASEIFCFRVELPTGTGNDYQGVSTTATFTFHGEQIANNP